MVKSILFSLFAVALFAAGAVGSWYMTKLSQAEPVDELEQTAAVVNSSPTETAHSADLAEMSAPFLGKAMNAEDIFRFEAMNKKNLQRVTEQREALNQEELRLKLADKDLSVRKQEIEGILKQSQQSVAEAERMIVQLQTELKALKAEKEAEVQVETGPENASSADVQANTKVASGWLEMMPAETAAEQIKTLVNNGNKEYVLQLLGIMEQRNVAKILAGLEPQLGAELAESFKTASRPHKRK
jgi:hypothetical protein